jgi:hypothetical protein
MVGETGVTKMDSNAAGFMVNVAVFEVMPEKVAVISVVPIAMEDASPELLTIATPVIEEFHVADDVISCFDPSEKVPEAANCCVLPKEIFELGGVMVIEDKTAGVTDSVADGELTESKIAVMNVVPVLTDVTSPLVGAVLLIVETAVFDDVHVAQVVRLWPDPSARVPEAVNCCVVPLAMLALAGLTAMDITGEEMSAAVPVTPV